MTLKSILLLSSNLYPHINSGFFTRGSTIYSVHMPVLSGPSAGFKQHKFNYRKHTMELIILYIYIYIYLLPLISSLCAVKSPENIVVEQGLAVAQAVSRWLPTAAARVRVWAACGVCGGQSGTAVCFLLVLRFHLPIIIPPISPSS
jgi:hypothetical protein